MADVSARAINGTVRLTMAARTANDLGALQKGLKSLAERMGHPSCATGCDILHLGAEREFILGNNSELNPQPLPPVAEEFAARSGRTVTVAISDKVSGDINALTRAVGVVLGKLGCQACCSGFDIMFRRELDVIVLGDDLKPQGFGRFA